MIDDRRLVGIDLGIASDHTVRVLDGRGGEVCRRRARPTVESLAGVEAAALAGVTAQTRLEVVIEPTGSAWLPIAVFFINRGHRVFRVSSAKAADLRRFLSRHAKSNGIDADTLARLPLLAPDCLHPLELSDTAEAAALDRRVRACDRLTQQGALHQRRIKDLVRQLMPASPLTGELTKTDLAVLDRWPDPRALLGAGPARLLTVITKASHGQQSLDRAEQWRTAAAAAVELYGEHPAMAWADLAAEVATEVRLLAAVRAELAGHAAARAEAYRFTDPARLAASLPGLAEVGAPTVTAIVGRAGRFRTGRQFRSFTGLAPRASETGQTDRKGQPMSKAGNRLLRTTLIRAADNARRQDPSSPRSTGYRWSNAAPSTSKRAAWSPRTWPNDSTRCSCAACPTSSATPTAPRSIRPPPGRSSPHTGPCPARFGPAAAAASRCGQSPTARRGRPSARPRRTRNVAAPYRVDTRGSLPRPTIVRAARLAGQPEPRLQPRRRGAPSGQGHRPARCSPLPRPGRDPRVKDRRSRPRRGAKRP